ncbi:tRNA-dihydrouridine synthase family protein [Candidatus Micrarchaeota archaeon]|nr:tRNA-dihydrouridine synthase family protein [Candidatus Micrarchaeota archaeon]
MTVAELPGKAMLAPMADFTELPFRLLCRKYGADCSLVPLVSATAITRSESYFENIRVAEKENAGLQLFGAAPADFGIAVERITDALPFVKWLDLNCGCPSPRTTAGGAGSRLLKKPKLAAAMVARMKRSGLRVSVKMRLLPKMEKTLEFCKAMEKAGADFLIVHGRTEKQGYSGKADWDSIKKIRERTGIPVVGNGDINEIALGRKYVKEGYADAFMIGRAALSNPRIFCGKKTEGIEDAKGLLREYLALCNRNDFLEVNNAKLVATQFFRGFRGSAGMRLAVSKAKSIEDIKVFMQ